MKRNYALYLKDIFDAIGEIEEFTRGLTEQGFVTNKVVVRAIITDLIIIGKRSIKFPKMSSTIMGGFRGGRGRE